MAIDTGAIIDLIASHAMRLGVFDVVQKHEPKSAPNTGLQYAVYIASIEPVAAASGMASTAARLELTGRIYRNFITEPEDEIDPDLAKTLDLLMAAYIGNFDLDALARNIDIFGAHGQKLSGRAGYLRIDSKIFRVMDIVIPIIVNDAWEQVA
jgi:hypothetical protein